jgi:hypothetical protein
MNQQQPTHVDDDSARLKRIETTLFLLCRHLGLDPRTGDRLTAQLDNRRRND